MAVGVCIYPLGWDSSAIRAVCGATASRYVSDVCGISSKMYVQRIYLEERRYGK